LPLAPRVTVVTSRLDVGGAERHLTRVLPVLRRRGTDITLYVLERGGPLEAELTDQGVRIEGPERARFLRGPKAILALARFLRRERPDIVHFFLPRPYLYGSIAAELAGQRRRLMSRRSLTDYRARYPLLGGLERLLHCRTAGLIGNSRAVVDQLATEVGDSRKLGLIYSGIELPARAATADRRAVRRSLGIADDTLVFASVANLVAYKGHHDLLEALALSNGDLSTPWKLLAIGRDDGIGIELKRTAERLNVSANIAWLGERSDVAELLAASDLFVLPSHQEGFSNALLEAMAANVAVIASAVGGNLDAIADGETGILVTPKDSKSLAAAIVRLAGSPGLRCRLAEAARLRVQQCFSLDACVGRYERLYRAMSAPKPASIAEILADDSQGSRSGGLDATFEHANQRQR
jgi:glycosyltransferase involved in cell wall biosynthesis